MPCTVCTHNQIKEIDRALLTGATLISLSQQYGLSKSALHRHKNHLLEKMRQAKERLLDSLELGRFLKLNSYLELSLHNARAASTEGNFRASNQATREGTRIIALMAKMDLPLDQELVYCLMSSPQWTLEDSLLPGAFQALADARQTMSLGLLAPCPEPEPPPPDLDDDDDEDDADEWDEAEAAGDTSTSVLKNLDSDLETLPVDQKPALLQKIFPSLARSQASQSETENRKLETENRLFKRWENSGKSPGNTSSEAGINEQYQ